MSEVKWQDPPVATRGRGNRLISDELIAKLKSRPNEWLFVGRHIRVAWSRSVENHGEGRIEIVSRNNKNNVADIYLRWKA